MAKKNKSSTSETRWWNKISQTPSKSLSVEGKTKRNKLFLKASAYAAVFVIALGVIGAGAYVINKHVLPTFLSPFSKGIKRIVVDSDGVLKDSHLLKILELHEDEPLMSLDIYELKNRLEQIAQVKSAVIERKFPSTLIISLKEHRPILKMVGYTEDGIKEGYLVSDEGEVFKGYGYSSEFLKQLIYLKGAQLRKRPEGTFYPIAELFTVNDLLSVARERMPHLYKRWADISIEYMRHGPQALGSFLKVRTKSGINIVFAPKAYMFQLERLDSILTYVSEQKLSTIERIDLSINGQVAVKIARNPRKLPLNT